MTKYKKSHSYTEEPISHMSLPIEDCDLERTRTTMTRHGASIRKIRSPDNWWIILFPDKTLKIRDPSYIESTRHKVLFPDGFWFLFDQGIMGRDGTYKQLPVLHIAFSGGDENEATEKTVLNDIP